MSEHVSPWRGLASVKRMQASASSSTPSQNREGLGPDLPTEGSRGRTEQWLTEYLRNPRAYVKNSIKPPYRNLTDEQMRALVAFL